MTPPPELLRVDGLSLGIGDVPIVEDVTFAIDRGETLGVVGESGSGKSLTALAILRLLPPPVTVLGGSVTFEGASLLELSERRLRDVRGSGIGMIFQDPVRSLNPAFTIGEQIAEALRWHLGLSRREAWRRSVELLDEVGIRNPERRARDYPHTFSGGMCQRAMIAIALACGPSVLIADEPTTALDVTTQRQILELIRGLQDRLSLAVLFISHDLSVVADVCDRIVVLYAGQVVEQGATRELMTFPRHPYTATLLACAAGAVGDDGELASMPGAVPSPGARPAGCRLHPRCAYATDLCRQTMPRLEGHASGPAVRCHHAAELALEGVQWQPASSR